MHKIIIIALIGVCSQVVVGSMGMGYGVIATTALTSIALLSPAVASARCTCPSWAPRVRSGSPTPGWATSNGGSFDGSPSPARSGRTSAMVLSSLSTKTAAPVMSGILSLLGIYIVVRFLLGITASIRGPRPIRFLGPLGLVAGFVDATGGGGWGSLATTTLLADGRLEPRKIIGSMDTSRFLVSAAAVLGFLVGMGVGNVRWSLVLALMIGGVLAAPFAAYLVKHIKAEPLGVAVGSLILLINSRVILKTFDAPDALRWSIYVAIVLICAAGLFVVAQRAKRTHNDSADHSDAAPVQEGASV